MGGGLAAGGGSGAGGGVVATGGGAADGGCQPPVPPTPQQASRFEVFVDGGMDAGCIIATVNLLKASGGSGPAAHDIPFEFQLNNKTVPGRSPSCMSPVAGPWTITAGQSSGQVFLSAAVWGQFNLQASSCYFEPPNDTKATNGLARGHLELSVPMNLGYVTRNVCTPLTITVESSAGPPTSFAPNTVALTNVAPYSDSSCSTQVMGPIFLGPSNAETTVYYYPMAQTETLMASTQASDEAKISYTTCVAPGAICNAPNDLCCSAAPFACGAALACPP